MRQIRAHFLSWMLWIAPVLLLTPNAHADLSGDLDSFFNNINLNVTDPGVYEGQNAGYFTGGGIYMRVPQRNYNLLTTQFPKIRAGCGGIDLYTGGFAYMNSADFTNMLQTIGSNAASYFFMLALRSISPQIASTMEKIQSWMQKFNMNNINSCNAARSLVGGAMGLFGVQNSACILQLVENGESYADARLKCTSGGQTPAVVDNPASSVAKQIVVTGNIAWQMLMRNSYFESDTDLAEVMMNLSGTVIVRRDTPGNADSTTSIEPVPSILLGNEGKRLLQAMLEGNGTSVIIRRCSNGTGADQCTEMNTTAPVTITNGLISRVEVMLVSVADKIRADTALSTSERGLLSATNLPVLKYLTVQQAYLPEARMAHIRTYATLIAKDILFTYLDDLFGKQYASINTLPSRSQEQVKLFEEGLTTARREIKTYKQDVRRHFDEAMAFTTQVRQLEKAVISRLSPGMFRNATFSTLQ